MIVLAAIMAGITLAVTKVKKSPVLKRGAHGGTRARPVATRSQEARWVTLPDGRWVYVLPPGQHPSQI